MISGVCRLAPGARRPSPGASHSPICHWYWPSCSHSMVCWWLPDQARCAPKTRPVCSVLPGVVTTAPGKQSCEVRPRRFSRRHWLRPRVSVCSRNSWLCWPAYERTVAASPGKGRVPAASHCTSMSLSPRLVKLVCRVSTSVAASSAMDTSKRSCATASVRCSTRALPGVVHSTSHWVMAWAKSSPARCASSALCPNQPTPKVGSTVSGWSKSSMKDGSGRVPRSAWPGVLPSGRRGPQ